MKRLVHLYIWTALHSRSKLWQAVHTQPSQIHALNVSADLVLVSAFEKWSLLLIVEKKLEMD